MAFLVRLDPDDGTPPALLEFAEYHAMFTALVGARLSFLAPIKRFRGPHARFDIPPGSVPNVLDELARVRAAAPAPQRFLDALEQLAHRALQRGAGLMGRSP